MKIDIRRGTIHGGSAKGVITASSAGHVGIDLALDDVSALETLNNSGRFEMLDGRARIRLAVAGHGATEKEIVDTLGGSASIDIANGAILGWSIDDILASARRLELPNLERNASARTPFSRLSATLAIKDGVATGQDMRIASSPISLDSAGTIDLRARTLDLTLNPRVADNASAGSANRFAGLSVPLELSGPWHRPRLKADYQKILKSPAKVIDAARDAARGIKDEDIDKAAKRFLGDTSGSGKGRQTRERPPAQIPRSLTQQAPHRARSQADVLSSTRCGKLFCPTGSKGSCVGGRLASYAPSPFVHLPLRSRIKS